MPSTTAQLWHAAYDAGVPTEIDDFRVPLPRLLDDAAARYPARSCTTFNSQTLNYGQVSASADRFAGGLRGLGVGAGDRVALLLPNCPPFVIGCYGALKAGAVVVPMNPLCTAPELTGYLRESGAVAIVTVPPLLGLVAPQLGHGPLRHVIVAGGAQPDTGADGTVVAFEALLGSAPAAAEKVDPGGVALLMFTGGTTGAPKAIMLSHAQCVAHAKQAAAWGRIDADDRFLAVLPLFHGFGMSITMNVPLLAGAEIVLLPRFQPAEVLDAIERYRPTLLIGVPTMFAALTAEPDLAARDLTSIQGVFVGAAPLTRAIKDGFEAATGARMIEGYGLTEAVTAVMANPYHGVHKLGSVGVPFPGVDARIVSLDGGRDLPPGEQGEIVLRSPTVMIGYAGDPDTTARTIRDGWLYTGDVGWMDQDGYFYVTDRIKEMIITGGFNVFPREVDKVLEQHPDVRLAAVIGVPDPRSGERIRAYVVLRPGATLTADELVAYARENLVPYKVPSEIVFRTELPMTFIGKVARRELQDGAGHDDPVHDGS